MSLISSKRLTCAIFTRISRCARGNLKIRDFKTPLNAGNDDGNYLPIPLVSSSLTKLKFSAKIKESDTRLKLLFCGISKISEAKLNYLVDQPTQILCHETATAQALADQQQNCLEHTILVDKIHSDKHQSFLIVINKNIDSYIMNDKSRWEKIDSAASLLDWRQLSNHNITQITSIGISSGPKQVEWNFFTTDRNMCDINDCDNNSNSCQNGAQCIDGINAYYCDCVAGFSGVFCEADVDDCYGVSCQNGAECVDGINSYTCNCPPGFSGDLCDVDIDECSSNPCQNGGSCNDGINSFSCTCLPGFEGDSCQVNVDECASNSCQNGATCVDGINTYTCSCLTGFEGTLCQVNIDDCSPNPCQNGGSCNDGINSFSCSCLPGFEGNLCEVNTDECISNICQNGATCVDGINAYTCNCLPGFEGTLCDENIDDCSPNPCQNGGICTDGINSFTCKCTGEKIPLSNPRFGDGKKYGESASPDVAIDGEWLGTSGGQAIHSFDSNYPSFLVDLPHPGAKVTSVVVYPRQSELNDNAYGRYIGMQISIDGNNCETSQSLTWFSIKANKESGIWFKCENGITGSTVKLQNGNNFLHIAELIAFGPGFEGDLCEGNKISWTTFQVEYHTSHFSMAESDCSPKVTIKLDNPAISPDVIFENLAITGNTGQSQFSPKAVRRQVQITEVKLVASCNNGWLGHIAIVLDEGHGGKYQCKYNNFETYWVDGDGNSVWNDSNGKKYSKVLNLNCVEKPEIYSEIRSYYLNSDQWQELDNFFPGDRGMLNFAFEFEVKVEVEVRFHFCEDDKCLELIIGGWDANPAYQKSIFRSHLNSGETGLVDLFASPNMLSLSKFRIFRFVFDVKGGIKIFTVSDQETDKINNRLRNQNPAGGLVDVDDNIITQPFNYEEIDYLEKPWIEVQGDFRTYSDVNIINGINKIKFKTRHRRSAWNFMIKETSTSPVDNCLGNQLCLNQGKCVDGLGTHTCLCIEKDDNCDVPDKKWIPNGEDSSAEVNGVFTHTYFRMVEVDQTTGSGVTWDEARLGCQSIRDDASLAAIYSSKENDLIYSMAIQTCTSNWGSDCKFNYWIGWTRNGGQSKWIKDFNGDPYGDVIYTNFMSGEPNGENTRGVGTSKAGNWYDGAGSTERDFYVCQLRIPVKKYMSGHIEGYQFLTLTNPRVEIRRGNAFQHPLSAIDGRVDWDENFYSQPFWPSISPVNLRISPNTGGQYILVDLKTPGPVSMVKTYPAHCCAERHQYFDLRLVDDEGSELSCHTNDDLSEENIPNLYYTGVTWRCQRYGMKPYSLTIASQRPSWTELGTFPGQGTLDFTLDFEIKAIACAFILFCEDNQCIELVIGGWYVTGVLKSIFRSQIASNNSPFYDKFDTPGILDATQYRAFRVVFTPDGAIKVFKTSDQINSELNSLPRNQDGTLLQDSYVTIYETTPLMKIHDFQSNPNVNIANGINKIKFGVGWGEEHNQVQAKWNFRILPNLVASQSEVKSYSLVIPNENPNQGQWGTLSDFAGKGTLDFSLEFENKAPSSAEILFCEDDECVQLIIGGHILSGTLKSIFKSRPYNNNNHLKDLFNTPEILDPSQYKAFKIVFSPDGSIKLYKTSNQVSSEINNLPRNSDGSLVDKTYITEYEETPLLTVINFRSNSDVNIVNGINKIKFVNTWGSGHSYSTSQWNFKIDKAYNPSATRAIKVAPTADGKWVQFLEIEAFLANGDKMNQIGDATVNDDETVASILTKFKQSNWEMFVSDSDAINNGGRGLGFFKFFTQISDVTHYDAAEQYCAEQTVQLNNREYFGSLASVYSEREIDIILNIDDDLTGPVWIGGQDFDKDGVWRWIQGIDGGYQRIGYFRWAGGEPSTHDGGTCMAIKRSPDASAHGRIHSRSCSVYNADFIRFACQIRLPQITCDNNPCQNNGVCNILLAPSGETFSCSCFSGFTGDLCEKS